MKLVSKYETIYVINQSNAGSHKKARTIDDLFIKYIEVLTVSKVGTQNIVEALAPITNDTPRLGSHNLLTIYHNDNYAHKYTNIIYVCGIRNPIEWAMSYMFATYDKQYAGPQFKTNNYELINTFICETNDIFNMSIDEITNIFLQKKYYNIFNDFFKEFFEITVINTVAFNKTKGYQIYEYKPGKFILFYVLEKYGTNVKQLSTFLNLNIKCHVNPVQDEYKPLYDKFKQTIKLPPDYKKNSLDTDYVKYFYTNNEINNMYNKY
jgi:hypothetical protein